MPHEETSSRGPQEGAGVAAASETKPPPAAAPPGTRRVKLRDVNAHLACVLCGGYLVDATTIVECLHSFCRSCIIKYLETNNLCPICDAQIHKAKPFLNIKPDKTLQDIVYKLVPGLFQAEMRRRREFYAQHPEQVALTTPEERGVGVERIIYSPEDSISLSLEYYVSSGKAGGGGAAGEEGAEGAAGGGAGTPHEGGSPAATPAAPGAAATPDPKEKPPQQPNGEVTNGCGPPPPPPSNGPSAVQPASIPNKRYLRCPAVVTIGHLKKFLRLKFDLSEAYRVDVIHRGVCLPEDYTLMDVAYIYTWKRSEPMEFMYRIHEPPRTTIRRKKRPAPEAIKREVAEHHNVNGKVHPMVNGDAAPGDNAAPSKEEDQSDDPPPPKLERMSEGPKEDDPVSLVDRETLLPPKIDRPEGVESDEMQCEEPEKREVSPAEKEVKLQEETRKQEESKIERAPATEIAPESIAPSAFAKFGRQENRSVAAPVEKVGPADPTLKTALEAPLSAQTPIARPHSTPGATGASQPVAARSHHSQQQQLPSPRPASSPPALVAAQQTQGSAGDNRKGAQTPTLPKDSAAEGPSAAAAVKEEGVTVAQTSSHPDRKRSGELEESEAVSSTKRDRSGALDLSGGSSRLSGDPSPPASPTATPVAALSSENSSVKSEENKNIDASKSVPSDMTTTTATSSSSVSDGIIPSTPEKPAANSTTKKEEAAATESQANKVYNATVSVASSKTSTLTNTTSSCGNSSLQNSRSTPTSNSNSSLTNKSPNVNTTTATTSSSTPTKTSSTSTTYSSTPSVTSNVTTTSTASSRDAGATRVSTAASSGSSSHVVATIPSSATRIGKVTKGQSTQTLQSIADNLARSVQQKQLQQQQQQQKQQQQKQQQQQQQNQQQNLQQQQSQQQLQQNQQQQQQNQQQQQQNQQQQQQNQQQQQQNQQQQQQQLQQQHQQQHQQHMHQQQQHQQQQLQQLHQQQQQLQQQQKQHQQLLQQQYSLQQSLNQQHVAQAKQAALQKSSPCSKQKPLQHVQPLQTPKYTPQSKLQQHLQQQTQSQAHHLTQQQQQLLNQQAQAQLHQHLQIQLQQHLQQQQHLLMLKEQQKQQEARNRASPKTTPVSQAKGLLTPTSSVTSTATSTPPVTITISTKPAHARQGSPLNRSNPSPVNAVSPQGKTSGLTLSLGQINHHGASSNSRPSPKRSSPQVPTSNTFQQQNNSIHHHHVHPHVSISQHANNGGSCSTSPASSATSPGYPDSLSPMSSLSPFAARVGSMRSPPPPLAPPPPPPPPSHHNSHNPGAALKIPVPPSGKPRPSSLSSSSPSPSPPGDQHSTTPSPNGHSTLAHPKASPNGSSPGLSARLPHDPFGVAASHHLHSGSMISPHGHRFRQQMELQSRHLAEQHLQQVAAAAAHQQSASAAATSPSASTVNPQLLQHWHQMHQLHLRQQQQQTANVSSSAAALPYPLEWYAYPQSVKLLEYFMKLGPIPMYPFNNNTTSANNNSAGSATTRK